MSQQELVEVRVRAREAGFNEVSTFVWDLLKGRQEVDRWRFDAAKEAARLILRFNISNSMLEQAKRELTGR